MSYSIFISLWILTVSVIVGVPASNQVHSKLTCISHDPETNYFKFFECPDHEYCCGEKPTQMCCPKISVGAIVGIVLTAVVFLGLTICCVASCCLWCKCCLYKRARDARRRRSSFRSADINIANTETDKLQHRPALPTLTLRIGATPDDACNAPPRVGGVILGPRASIDLHLPQSPLSPTTPMSIASPSEFSKLIAHDWDRQKHKEEVNPYQDTTEEDIQQPNYHRSDLP